MNIIFTDENLNLYFGDRRQGDDYTPDNIIKYPFEISYADIHEEYLSNKEIFQLMIFLFKYCTEKKLFDEFKGYDPREDN